ncbi:hypothetical protein D3C80_1434580 [compost metagenome]
MHRHQLAENVGGQFADYQSLLRQHADQFVAISLAFRRGGQIKQSAVPGGDLQGFKTGFCRPLSDSRQAVEWGCVVTELGEMQAWTFQGFHRKLLLFVD